MKTQEIETTMPDEAKLTKLASLSKTLNSKTDAINAAIGRLEKRLAEMNIGLEVWLGQQIAAEGTFVETDDNGENIDPNGWVREWSIDIGYTKIGDEWHIASRRVLDLLQDTDYYGNPNPTLARTIESGLARALTSAPRAVRIEALPLIEKLVDRLIMEAEKSIKVIDEAVDKF